VLLSQCRRLTVENLRSFHQGLSSKTSRRIESMLPLTVKTGDGEFFAVSDADWQIVASPSLQVPYDGRNIQHTLAVRKHRDGRRLVYALVEREGEVLVAAGMIVPAGTEMKVPLWKIAAENGLTEWHIQQCQAKLDEAG
jgi:hypothetical protein